MSCKCVCNCRPLEIPCCLFAIIINAFIYHILKIVNNGCSSFISVRVHYLGNHIKEHFFRGKKPKKLSRCEHITPTFHTIHFRPLVIYFWNSLCWNKPHSVPTFPVLVESLFCPCQCVKVIFYRLTEEHDLFRFNSPFFRSRCVGLHVPIFINLWLLSHTNHTIYFI